MGIDLSQITPMTEDEAEAIFNRPTVYEKYLAAMQFMAATYEYQHEDILKYVQFLKSRIRTLEGSLHGLEERTIYRDHQMGQ